MLISYKYKYKLSSYRRGKKKMNIGKAASLSGLTIKTVRYYSDIGIIYEYEVNINWKCQWPLSKRTI